MDELCRILQESKTLKISGEGEKFKFKKIESYGVRPRPIFPYTPIGECLQICRDQGLEFSRLKFELGLHERRFGGVDFIARKRGNVVLIFFSREIFT